jgi:hypothetical protein
MAVSNHLYEPYESIMPGQGFERLSQHPGTLMGGLVGFPFGPGPGLASNFYGLARNVIFI